MQEKFFLPCSILETKSYNEAVKAGRLRPFETDTIVICSYQFARTKAADIRAVPWDLVVIDEAHRLRNVYKPSNVIARALRDALQQAPKLLLTATPLQNSLLELFGLVSFVDELAFGDLASFREQFARLDQAAVFDVLKARLKPVCHRTLRRQVLPYVRYTKRLPLVQPFRPEESEDRLYNLVSDYLQRDNLQALPASQRSLMTLVLRKLLASSSFAIAGALESLGRRLTARLGPKEPPPLEEVLGDDYEALPETADEWSSEDPAEPLSAADRRVIEREIADLESFRQLAMSITSNAKGRSLLTALETAFRKAEVLGAARKALIFTESRRTQEYLLRVLGDSPYAEGVVLFNGSNADPRSREIYNRWRDRHAGTDRVTGSRTADMRSALVDYFREEGRIMIATEAGAEGINLQFCSLVVNYDLPWNPQRVEQRIGRCHRYGQEHDVVVVNFPNQNNEADQRVFQLLSEKFRLFEGVFGASDEVLGAIESGVDFEKRIVAIYQTCRRPGEIREAFDRLQAELSAQIDDAMTRTRQQLLENFDEEVHEKLRINLRASTEYRKRYEQILMELTRHELDGHAQFRPDMSAFELLSDPFGGADDTSPPRQQGNSASSEQNPSLALRASVDSAEVPLGLYELPRRSGEAHLYRFEHPLAVRVLNAAKQRCLPPAELTFDLSNHLPKIAALEPLAGQSGVLTLSLYTVASLDQTEDHLIFAAVTDEDRVLEEETARRLFSLSATVRPLDSAPHWESVVRLQRERQDGIQQEISRRNARFFEAEANKLDGWADDLKSGPEREIKDLDRQIKEARRAATAAATLEEKLAGQKQVRALEAQRSQKRRSLFDAQDDIDRQRGRLIAEIESKLAQETATDVLFGFDGM